MSDAETYLDEKINSSGAVSGLDNVEGDLDRDEVYSPREQRKILHKIDRRLVTGLGLLMCVSLVDRTNLGNAMIAGMEEELRLYIGSRYSITLLTFFIPYVLFQFPLITVIRKIGPKIFLSGITFSWGIVMMGFGFIHNWTVLVGLRIVLGFLEAGLFPGSVYLLSMWYTRYDLHKRYSSFYLISVIGGAFSGILSYGFVHMNGLGNLSAWRWIFVMEGILTCLVGVVGFFLIVNFPNENNLSWKFLSKEETAFVVRRLNRDRRDSSEAPFNLKEFLKPALDLKIWGFALIFFSATVVSYAITFFLPLILRSELKFPQAASQVLTTPPYFFAGIFMYVQGWIGDKYHIRAPLIIYNCVQCIVGLAILGWVQNPGVQYFGIFLVTSASNATIPAALTYQANNIRGQWKRAFCSASIVSFGGTGGVAGSLVFRSQDSPRYLPGLYACIACNLLSIVVVCILSLYFYISNRRAARGKLVIEGLPEFRYTL
ncbi:major facilitator superfamily domain-containing protein [Aspergillus novoparasiticus]|uniref:Major facilitator superfamily domain-containing protein n=1 Tax=Aspergillus novoparasiticus TaxID=986946 RepID=A0A5N6ELQ1_9EURO|nr:major facilitator superfamily domain-containing protein [Aspergillus novoparasiticus]